MRSVMLTTSAAGTVMFLVYIGVWLLGGSKLKAKWKRILLLLVMGYYLAPIANLKYRVYGCVKGIFFKQVEEGRLDAANIIYLVRGEEKIFTIGQKLLMGGLLLSGIVSLGIVLYLCRDYVKLRKAMKQYRGEEISENCRKIFFDAAKELRIKQKVSVQKSPDVSEPFTSGVFKPVIWLPGDIDKFSESEYRNIIYHELAHIRHHDLAISFLGLLIIALHWFNPFSYLLLYCICNVNEQYCDETALEYVAYNGRRQYCDLLIAMSSESAYKYRMNLCFFGHTKRCVKEREEMEALSYDDFFTDEEGQIYQVTKNMSKAGCKHDYRTGTRQIHTKNSAGGCTVYYYYANRCTLCGNVVMGECYQTLTNKVCPH